MNETQNNSAEPINNPWKIGVFSTAGAVILLVVAGITFAAFNTGNTPTEQPNAVSQAVPSPSAVPQPTPSAVPQPTPSAVTQSTPSSAVQPLENCDQYRSGVQRDSMRIAKDGAVGAVIGAGTGAAGGAIADGGSGAGKGAGIGAVVGAVAGAAYGMTEENKRASDAESAYQACITRNRNG